MTATPDTEAAIERAAIAAVDMLSGMIAARAELGMSDDEMAASILASLTRMINA